MERIFSLSTLIYIQVFVVTLAIYYIFSKKVKLSILSKAGMVFPLLLLSIFSGIRYNVGTDYWNYTQTYNNALSGSEVKSEIGFRIIYNFLTSLNLESNWFFFVATFLTFLFFLMSINRSKTNISKTFALFIFLFVFFQSSFNIVRMALAVSITLYNLKHIEEERPIKYLLFSLLAMSFHTSAIVTIPMYYLTNKYNFSKNKTKTIFLYILIVVLLYNLEFVFNRIILSFDYYYISRYSYYLRQIDREIIMNAIIQLVFYIMILIPGVIYYKDCSLIDSRYKIYFSYNFIGIAVLFSSIFLPDYIYRLADYFMIPIIFTVPIYDSVLRKKKLILLRIGIRATIFMYWIIWYFLLGRHGTYLFQTIF